jgi:hypothetical protein
MLDEADSSGVRKELGELFRWCHESERLARTVVKAGGDAGEILSGVHEQVGTLGQVLAEKPVGVLVGPALPGLTGQSWLSCR